MVEHNDREIDYLEAIESGLGSGEVRSLFEGSDKSRRVHFLQSLEESARSLRRLNSQLTRKEKQKQKGQLGITIVERP